MIGRPRATKGPRRRSGTANRCNTFQAIKIHRKSGTDTCTFKPPQTSCVVELVFDVSIFDPDERHTQPGDITYKWETLDGIIHNSDSEKQVGIWVTSTKQTNDVEVKVTVTKGSEVSVLTETFETHHKAI